MARQQVTTFTDDLTGKPVSEGSARTVHVVVDGAWHELDVSGETYRKVVEPLIEAARKVPNPLRSNGNVVPIGVARSNRGQTSTAVPDKAQRQALRLWWQQNQGRDGLPSYSERGRIPVEVQMGYDRHGGLSIPLPATKTVAARAKAQDADAGQSFAEAAKPRARKSAKATPAKAPAKAAAPAASRARKRVTKP